MGLCRDKFVSGHVLTNSFLKPFHSPLSFSHFLYLIVFILNFLLVFFIHSGHISAFLIILGCLLFIAWLPYLFCSLDHWNVNLEPQCLSWVLALFLSAYVFAPPPISKWSVEVKISEVLLPLQIEFCGRPVALCIGANSLLSSSAC